MGKPGRGSLTKHASLPLSVYPTASAVIQAEIQIHDRITSWSFTAPLVATVVLAFAGFSVIILGNSARRRRLETPLGLVVVALVAFVSVFVLYAGFWGLLAGVMFMLAAFLAR